MLATAYPSRAHRFTPGFICWYLVSCPCCFVLFVFVHCFLPNVAHVAGFFIPDNRESSHNSLSCQSPPAIIATMYIFIILNDCWLLNVHANILCIFSTWTRSTIYKIFRHEYVMGEPDNDFWLQLKMYRELVRNDTFSML